MARKLLFSVTADDCEWQDMTAGGPGGQHQNRSHTAIRVTHRPSGAVGISREYRSQLENKRAAFRRMAETESFRTWVRQEAARMAGEKSLDEQVEELMQPQHLKVEVRTEGTWTQVAATTTWDEP